MPEPIFIDKPFAVQPPKGGLFPPPNNTYVTIGNQIFFSDNGKLRPVLVRGDVSAVEKARAEVEAAKTALAKAEAMRANAEGFKMLGESGLAKAFQAVSESPILQKLAPPIKIPKGAIPPSVKETVSEAIGKVAESVTPDGSGLVEVPTVDSFLGNIVAVAEADLAVAEARLAAVMAPEATAKPEPLPGPEAKPSLGLPDMAKDGGPGQPRAHMSRAWLRDS